METHWIEPPDIHKMSVDELVHNVFKWGKDKAVEKEINRRPEEQIEKERNNLEERRREGFEALDLVVKTIRELRDQLSEAASWEERQEIERKISAKEWYKAYTLSQIGEMIHKRSMLQEIRKKAKIGKIRATLSTEFYQSSCRFDRFL